MIDNFIIFFIASFMIILFAIFSLCAKNVINSLLWAILVFFLGALFFYIIGSEYNAIIQTAIYGLAVPVIIGVSIMFTQNVKSETKIDFRIAYLTIMSVAIFVLAFVYLMKMSLVITPNTFHIMEIPQFNSFDTISAFAKGIFVDYVWAFELVSLLLTIVIAGFSMINKRRKDV